jgi:hypothetical protein
MSALRRNRTIGGLVRCPLSVQNDRRHNGDPGMKGVSDGSGADAGRAGQGRPPVSETFAFREPEALL